MAKAKIFAGCVRNQSDAMFFWICVLIGMVGSLACFDVSQSKWLMRGLDPQDKSARLAQYLKSLRKEIPRVCHSAGVAHPVLMDSRHIEISDGQLVTRTLQEVYGSPEGSLRVSPSEFEKVTHWMNSLSDEGSHSTRASLKQRSDA